MTHRELYRRRLFEAYQADPNNDLLAAIELVDNGYGVFPDEVEDDTKHYIVVGADGLLDFGPGTSRSEAAGAWWDITKLIPAQEN